MTVQWRLMRSDGVVVDGPVVANQTSFLVDFPNAAGYTYTLQYYADGGSDDYIDYAAIVALVVKR
jgi:hypothetical protein